MTALLRSRRSALSVLAATVLLAAALTIGALSHPQVAQAACTNSSNSGAIVGVAQVGSPVTVRVWTDTDAPLGGSADIIRPDGTRLKSVSLDFGPQTPGGYYFAPATWTPGTAGTWKVKYSIQMPGCPTLQTGTKNVDVS